jgi:hypothetical protein
MNPSVEQFEKLSEIVADADKMNEEEYKSTGGHATDSDNAGNIEEGSTVAFGGETTVARAEPQVFSPAASVGNTEIHAAATMFEMVGERDSVSPGDGGIFNINQYLGTLGTVESFRRETTINCNENVDAESMLAESTREETNEVTKESATEEAEAMIFDEGNVANNDDDEESIVSASGDEGNTGSEDEEEVMNTTWIAEDIDYHHVKVTFEDVGETLKEKLREGVEQLRHRITNLKKTQTFETDVVCDELHNFSAFANIEFWQHLIQFLNKNRDDGIEPVDGFAISKFVRCILWCAYYQKSPGHMMSNKSLFPGFASELRAMGGTDRFNEIKSLFKSPKRQLSTSWDAYFALIPDIRKLVRIISENCAAVAFTPGSPNDITIDDDKWRFRSSNWSELGYSRRKGIKSFGCVLNMACDCPTGLFVSGAITSFGENATNSTKVILQRALHVETTEEVMMMGSMIHGDRGYNDDAFLKFCNQINASLFFTVKRGPTLPYSFGSTGYK